MYKQGICGLHGNQSTSWLPLTQVAQADMHYCADKLHPIVMEMVQDFNSLAKVEVALWNFGGDHRLREQGWWGRMGRAGREDREGGKDNTIVTALKNSLLFQPST